MGYFHNFFGQDHPIAVWRGAQEKELALGTVPPGASLVYTIELVHLEKARCHPCHALVFSGRPNMPAQHVLFQVDVFKLSTVLSVMRIMWMCLPTFLWMHPITIGNQHGPHQSTLHAAPPQAKDSWEMNDEEKVAAAGAAKDAGNKAFKAGRWARAAKKYKAANDAISYDDKFTDELKRQARDMPVRKIRCRAGPMRAAGHAVLRTCNIQADEVESFL